MTRDCRFQACPASAAVTERIESSVISRLWVLLLALALLLAVSRADGSKPTAKQILETAAKNYDVIKDYTADASVSVESPSIYMPEMKVKIYYKSPDKLHLESGNGFAVLPKQGALIGNPLRELIAASELSVAGSARVLDHDCHVVKGSFWQDGRNMHTTVWIDKKHHLVRQVAANPEWGPSVRIKLWYVRVANRYWLPATTVAQVSIPPLPRARPEDPEGQEKPAIMTIKFSNYRVNTGLSDKIFEQQKAK